MTTRDDRRGRVVVTDASPAGLTQVVRAGRHVLIVDEPLGTGDDLGPTPYDLLLAALGACTAMTVRLYAERKGWLLTEITVGLTHDRVRADDGRDSTTTPRTVARIDCVVSLTGALSDGQRDRLLAIAQRCPLHRTLTTGLRIVTRLRE
jgi:putative redox protein